MVATQDSLPITATVITLAISRTAGDMVQVAGRATVGTVGRSTVPARHLPAIIVIADTMVGTAIGVADRAKAHGNLPVRVVPALIAPVSVVRALDALDSMGLSLPDVDSEVLDLRDLGGRLARREARKDGIAMAAQARTVLNSPVASMDRNGTISAVGTRTGNPRTASAGSVAAVHLAVTSHVTKIVRGVKIVATTTRTAGNRTGASVPSPPNVRAISRIGACVPGKKRKLPPSTLSLTESGKSRDAPPSPAVLRDGWARLFSPCRRRETPSGRALPWGPWALASPLTTGGGGLPAA